MEQLYHTTGTFGRVNIWQIAKLKVTGKMFGGKWIDFDHKDELKFVVWFKFGEPQMIHQIQQTFLLPNISAIQYNGLVRSSTQF